MDDQSSKAQRFAYICMECGKVRIPPLDDPLAGSYLRQDVPKGASTSHGYCDDCGEAWAASLEVQ